MTTSRFAATQVRQRRTDRLEALARKHRPDYTLLIAMTTLLVVGAVVVFSIGPGLTVGKNLSENYFSTKQMTAILLGFIGFLVAAYTPIDRWKKMTMLFVILAFVVAVSVRLFGEEINGAHRWIQVGGLSFQAAELIKLAIVLWLASYLASQRLAGTMGHPKTLKTLGALLLLIMVLVAGLQSDLGSAAVMMAIVAGVAFVAGLPLNRIFIFAGIIITVMILAVVVSPYRRDRVLTFLNPTADCQAEGYQACQALITIGSGGMLGKGLGRSVQAYGYMPEPANDSIFAIVAEKFGYLGVSVVLACFVFLFTRIKQIAIRAPSDYTRLLVVGVLVWLSSQMIINVGAMIGLMPLKGITLPFVSYGGTSIIFVMIAMGIVFQVSRYTELVNIKERSPRQTDRVARTSQSRGIWT
jgi:cell division protein FtsW